MNHIEFWRSGEFEVSRGTDVSHEYPRHWHDETLVCTIDRGGGELYFRGSWHPTPAGCVFLVPAGEIHANRGFCSHYNLYVSDSLGGWKNPVVSRSPSARALVRLCRSVVQPSSALERDSHWLELRLALRGDALPRVGREPAAVRRTREYLSASYTENISLDRIAAIAGLSPYHINRAFRQAFGVPPHVFLVQMRLARARALLREGRSPANVAAETGFTDQSHLTRHFRRVFGVTPGAYRDRKNVQYHPRTAPLR